MSEAASLRASRISASLVVKTTRTGAVRWWGSWRDSTGRSILRTLGPAWLAPWPLPSDITSGCEELTRRETAYPKSWERSWRRRRGRPKAGELDDRGAAEALRAAVFRREVELDAERSAEAIEQQGGPVTLARAAAAWLDHRERVKGLRGSSLTDYRSTLRAHILSSATLTRRPLVELTAADVIVWRDELDGRRDDGGERVLSRRTVNKARTVLHGVVEYACRPIEQGGFGLPSNPVRWCEPLGEDEPEPREPLTPAEVVDVARVLREGRHRRPARHGVGPRVKGRTMVERRRTEAEIAQDEQDAARVLTLGFGGMRVGEAAALRWRRVHFAEGVFRVWRSFSPTNGEETDTKGRERRETLMPVQVAQPLAKLSQRRHLTNDDDLVFTGGDQRDDEGRHIGYVDASAFRKRFARALIVAGITRKVRVHDLRHGFTTDARSVFTADHVQKFAGHKDARTAQRYAHARDQTDAATRWSDFLAEQIDMQAVR